MKNDTVPTQIELDAWSGQILAWFKETGRKYLSKALREELAERGAKHCPRCERVLLVEEFGKQSGRPQGLRSYCKGCVNTEQRDHNREAMQERRAKDPEYRQREREYERERRTEEEYRQYKRQYHADNYRTHRTLRLNIQLADGHRRAVKAGGVVEEFDAADLLDWWEEQGIPADRDYFTDEPLDPATRSVDHLWPVSKGGPHARWALVPVTIGTNRAKRTMSPSEFRDHLRSEGIEPADRPDPTPFISEARRLGAL